MKPIAPWLLFALTLGACGASEDASVEESAGAATSESPAAVVPEPVPVGVDPSAEDPAAPNTPSAGEEGLAGPEGTAAAQPMNGPAQTDEDRDEPMPMGEGAAGGARLNRARRGRTGAGSIGAPAAPAAPTRSGAPAGGMIRDLDRPRPPSAFDIEE